MLRKAYGLGAMALTGGGFHAASATVAWPTGEFGAMGLEGAVRLGYRKELEAVADGDRNATRCSTGSSPSNTRAAARSTWPRRSRSTR